MEVPNLPRPPTWNANVPQGQSGPALTTAPGLVPPAPPLPGQGFGAAQTGQGFGAAQTGAVHTGYGAAPPTWTSEMIPEKKVTEATTIERQEREAIVRETIIPQERIEVQPVIHREREVLELHQVTQPVYEKQVRATRIENTELPAEYREKIEGSQAEFQERLREGMEGLHSSVKWETVERKVIDQPPIIHETIKKIVREEVQPVIYREIVEPRVIRETLPIYERVVEAPRVFRESREPFFKDFPRESFRHLGHLDLPHHQGGHMEQQTYTSQGYTGSGVNVGVGPVSAGVHMEHGHSSATTKEQQLRPAETILPSAEMKGR